MTCRELIVRYDQYLEEISLPGNCAENGKNIKWRIITETHFIEFPCPSAEKKSLKSCPKFPVVSISEMDVRSCHMRI